MKLLSDLLDLNKLQKHIDDGFVKATKHPTLPLGIYNYTQAAAFAQLQGLQEVQPGVMVLTNRTIWGDGVIDYCRGLIVNTETGEIVSRPFKKFHNLNTSHIPETNIDVITTHFINESPIVTEKMDGSLGILWRFENEWGIATRGSFVSDQAKWATNWYKSQIDQGKLRLFETSEWTPLFEILYAENRIVVEYPFEGLVLLGMVNKHDGREQPPENLKLLGEMRGFTDKLIVPIYGKKPVNKFEDGLPTDEKNREGYVLSWPVEGKDPLKVKIKFDEYVTLHKIVTGLSPKAIWEILSQGGQDTAFMEKTPENFKKWANSWVDKLARQYNEIYFDAAQIFNGRVVTDGLTSREQRKLTAKYFTEQTMSDPELRSILFLMYDGAEADQLNDAIWKMIKPRGDDKSFRTDGE